MFDFSSLSSAKTKAKDNQEKNNEVYKKVYQEALDLYSDFENDEIPEKLEKAMYKFSEALKHKSNEPDPYFYLSVGFYLVGNIEKAKEYFEILENLSPEYEGLENFKNILND